MAEVVLQGISKSFLDPAGKRFDALHPTDLTIQSGECFSLLGPSGCGKTTLLRILAGLEFPDSGTVTMGGRDVTRLPPEKRPTAMVFQNYALFPHLTVEANVGFGLKLRKKSKAEIRRKVDEVLELVQLSGLGRRRIHELSGGQQQRVALGRVLAVEPAVILMDEPLSNLDASLRRTTRSVIRRIQKELNLTLVYVTHDQEEGLMISDRLALMQAGRILQAGSPRDLYERPASADVAMFLGQRNMVEAFVRAQSDGAHELTLTEPRPGGQGGETVRVTAPMIGGEASEGSEVWLALKPDDLWLEEPSAAREGWPAQVVLVSFAGSNVEVELKLEATGQIVRVFQDSREAGVQLVGGGLDRGDRVVVCVREGAGLIYSRQGDQKRGVAAQAAQPPPETSEAGDPGAAGSTISAPL